MHENSDSDHELNPIDNEDDEGDDETLVEDREILGPTEKEDDVAAVILPNARNVKELFIDFLCRQWQEPKLNFPWKVVR